MTADFVRTWAKKAWELDCALVGTMSGGIEGIKIFADCFVVSEEKAMILYCLPATCGLSDVRYHNPEPKKVRKDTFKFLKDGTILMNGKLFPGEYEAEPWTEEEAKEFNEEYAKAFKKDLIKVRKIFKEE